MHKENNLTRFFIKRLFYIIRILRKLFIRLKKDAVTNRKHSGTRAVGNQNLNEVRQLGFVGSEEEIVEMFLKVNSILNYFS